MRLCPMWVLAALIVLGCPKSSDHPAEVTETATLPASFPSGLPVYPGARLLAARDGVLDGGRPISVAVLESRDPVGTVSEFYDMRFKGYRRNATPDTTPTSHTLSLTEDDRHFDLILSVKKSGDKTLIDLKVSPF